MELTAGRVDAVGNGLQRLKIKGGGVDSVVGKDSAEEEVVRTPVKPSLKALGKRKVIEAEEPDRERLLNLCLTLSLNSDSVCSLKRRAFQSG